MVVGTGAPERRAAKLLLLFLLCAFLGTRASAQSFAAGSVTVPDGIVVAAGSGAGTPSTTAQTATSVALNLPTGVAVDAAGNLYIADSTNNEIEEVDPATLQLKVIAGGGTNAPTTSPQTATSVELTDPTAVAVDASGNVYICDTGKSGSAVNTSGRIEEVTPAGQLTVLAGDDSGTLVSYSTQTATTAEFGNPQGIALDGSGNIYVADTCGAWNGTTCYGKIEEYTASTGQIVEIAGSGTTQPTTSAEAGSSAELLEPHGVAVDSSGNVYVGDTMHYELDEITSGNITVVAGTGTADSSSEALTTLYQTATAVNLGQVWGVSVDGSGNVYLADKSSYQRNYDSIDEYSPSSGIKIVVGGYGNGAASPSATTPVSPTSVYLDEPQDVAVDTAGNFYIADSYFSDSNNLVLKSGAIGTDATFPETATGSSSTAQTINVELTAAETLTAITTSDSEFSVGTIGGCTLNSSNSSGAVCQVPVTFTPSSPGERTAELEFETASGVIGAAGLQGTGSGAQLTQTPGELTVIAGGGANAPSTSSQSATSVYLNQPHNLAFDSDGNLYVTDYYNSPQEVEKITGSNIAVIAGCSASCTTPVGGATPTAGVLATSCTLGEPAGVAVDPAGNVYIAGFTSDIVVKVDAVTDDLSVIAGGGTSRLSTTPNNVATSVSLAGLTGLSIDADGNIYVADEGDGKVLRLYPYGGGYGVVVVAGGGSTRPTTSAIAATSANIQPQDVYVGPSGNVYIADLVNWISTGCSAGSYGMIEKFTPATGQIVTVAGDINGGTVPTTTPEAAASAQLCEPYAVTGDAAGNLYVADTRNYLLERIDASTQNIEVIAGGGSTTPSTTGAEATSFSLSPSGTYNYGPTGVALDAAGDLSFADTQYNEVDKITGAGYLDFGSVDVNNTPSTAQSLTLTNIGNTSSSTASLSPTAQYNISTNGCGSTLAIGADCSLDIDFEPTETGTVTGNLTDSASNVNPSLTGVGVAAVSFSPSSPSYSADVGANTTGTVTVTNGSSQILTISGSPSITAGGTDFSIVAGGTTCTSGVTLAASTGTCTIEIEFAPSATGSRSGTLSVSDYITNSGGVDTQSLSLSGAGGVNGSVGPSTESFGTVDVGSQSSDVAFTFTNSGSVALTIASIAVSGTNSGDFLEDGGATNTCSGTLAANGGACTATYYFKPTATGSRSATLSLNVSYNSGSNVAISSSLSGTGQANIGFSPSPLAFSSVLVGSSSSMSVTATNSSSSAVNFEPANAGDVVQATGQTIALPYGTSFAALNLLGAAVNGTQSNASFTVTYTDGTNSTFTQSLSDWAATTTQTGEADALDMSYRDFGSGSYDNSKIFHVYDYSFTFSGGKTAASVTLPNNSDIVVLAMTLSGSGSPAEVNLNGAFNLDGIALDGGTVLNGGLDGNGYAYSANLLGSNLTAGGVTYQLGSAAEYPGYSASGDYSVQPCLPTAISPSIYSGNTLYADSTIEVTSGTLVSLDPSGAEGGSWQWSGGSSATTQQITVSPTSSTTYTATYTNACGDSSSLEFNVVVGASAVQNAIQPYWQGSGSWIGSNVIYIPSSTAITFSPQLANGGTGGSWSWTGTNIGGNGVNTSSSRQPAAVTVSSTSTYSVQATDSNGNTSYENFYVIVGGGGSCTEATPIAATSGSCTVDAELAPTIDGSDNGTLTLNDLIGSGSDVTQTDSLTGTGLGSAYAVAANAGTPQSATVGTAFATALQAKVTDSAGDALSGVSVTFTAPSTGASGTFANGTDTVTETTNSSGIATATTFTANDTSGSYNISAATSGASSASFAMTNNPGMANKLAFTTEPADTTAGTSFTVGVSVEDQYGNVLTSDSATSIMLAPSASTLNGTLTKTVSAGVASFTGLSMDTAGTYTITASASTLVSATSSSFTVSAGMANKLAFTTQPGNTTAGTSFTVGVSVEDQYGNVVTSDSATSITLAPSASTLNGTLTRTDSSGVASFTGLSMDTAGTYTITAAATGLTGATSSSFTISAGAANKLAFTTEPSNTTAGTSFTVGVSVEDQYGNVLTSDSATSITLAPSASTLNGTLTKTDSSGVASFTGLSMDTAGTYTITASASTLASATSASFTVSAGMANKLAFTTEPADTTAGTSFTVGVSVEDQYGNVLTSDAATSITLAPSASTLNGTLTRTDSSGVASFTGLSMDTAGTYTITAAATGLTGATSSSFTISAGAANKLAFTTEPGNTTAGTSFTVGVSVEDQYGNVLTSDSATSIMLAPSASTLNGTLTKADSSGVASFTGLSMDTAGTYTITASATGLTGATSSSFTISAGMANKLAFTTEPADTTAGTSFTVGVSVEDQYGNVLTSDAATSIMLAPSASTLNGTLTKTVSAGVASFTGLSMDTAGTYTITASASTLVSATSSSFTVSAGMANKLAFTTQPGNTTAGTSFTVGVSVEDQYGNVLTSDSATSIMLAPSASTLNGTLTKTDSFGVASFTGLSMDTAGTYTITAAATGLTGATSSSFTISAGAANKLAFTTEPGNTTAGTSFTVGVSVEDQYGNVLTSDAATSIMLAPSASTLNGTLTKTDSSGVASFTGLSMDTAGTYTITASASTLTSATSASFTVSAGMANKLAFTTEPADTTAGTSFTVGVSVEDQYGNVLTSDAATSITLAPSASTLNGTLTKTDSSGVASFTGLSMDTAGTYTITAAATGLTGATSSSFTISAGAANKLAFTTEPGNTTAGTSFTVGVSVEDQYGNVLTSDSATSIMLAPSASTLNGTLTKADSSGVASFTGLSMDTAGTYTITASATGLTGATSSSFTISAGMANKLAFTTEPADTTAGTSFTVGVSVEDQYGNVLTSDSATSIMLAPSASTLNGTLTKTVSAGVASFTGLSMDTAGTYTITASASTLVSATSSSFTVSAGMANKLAFTTQPGNTTAGTSFTVGVSVEDQYGNVVTSDSATSITLAPSASTLNGTLTRTDSSGVASFTGLSMDTAGTYTITAAATGLTGATSSSFTISAGAANKLAFTTEPSNTTAGTSFTVGVSVEDQYGNVLTSDSATSITLAPSASTLNGTLTKTDSSGVASFTGLSMDTAGTYTITASASTLASATSASFTVSAGMANKLAFTTEPADTTAGTSFTVGVSVEDQYGNVLTSDAATSITLAPSASTLNGTLTRTDSSGVASFTGLSMDTAGTYTITASATGLTGATSASFTISAGAANKLAFTTEPADTTAGTSFTVGVSVEDQYGNVLTSDSATSIMLAPSASTLNGTLTKTDSFGVASFTGLSMDTAGTYTITAAATGLTGATSSSFTISAGAANKLAFTTEPGNTTAGTSFTVGVSVEDQYGNVLTSDAATSIMLAPSASTLNGTLTKTDSSGVASFTGLSMDTAGTYTITASASTLTSATSASFTVSAGMANKLAFTTEPADTTAGTSFTVGVSVEDQYGNVLTSDAATSITLAPSASTLNGTLTKTDSSGVASFTGLSMDTAGTYTITAAATGLTGATSSSFTISAGAANKLAFTTEPGNTTAGTSFTVGVSVEDQYGNVLTSDSATSIMLAPSASTLNGTLTKADSSGVASFTGLSMDTAGTYTITASATGLTGATSSSFTISAGMANKLAFTTEPADTTAGTSFTVGVSVEDQYGNVLTSDSATSIMLAPSASTLNGTLTRTDSSGVASFTGLSMDTAGTYTITASATGLTGATSASFTISAGAANKLAFTTEPADTTAGTSFTVGVSVEDQYGNVLTSDSATSIMLAPSASTLNGTLTKTDSFGVASFTGLSMDTAGTYTITAAATGLTGATSSSFTISAGAANKLAFTTEPGNTTAGTSFTVGVSVEDQYGNVLTSDAATSIMLAPSASTLNGTLTKTDSSGVASFTGLSMDTAGTYTITASASTLTSATSASFTVSAGMANKLAFTTEPADTTAGTSFTVGVSVEDQYGNVLTSDAATSITLAPSASTLNGTLTKTDSSGVASFTGLSMDTAGTYTITAAATGLTGATSSSFTISAGAANKLAFTTEPGNTTAGTSFTVGVSVEDQYGNVLTSDSATSIMLAPSASTLNGTLTKADSSGVASFTGLSMDTAGTYTITASATGLTGATSSSFTISAGMANKLAFTTEPADTTAGTSFTVGVSVEDQYGNVLTSDSATSIMLAPSASTLNGTLTKADSSGVASFTGLSMDTAGTYTITASATGLTGATSSSFTISAGMANKLAFTTEPADTTAGTSFTVGVSVEDQYGNVVTSDAATSITLAPSASTLNGTLTVTDSSGVASFTGLSMDTAGTYTITAAATGLTGATSSSFTISAGAANKLAFTTEPGNTTAGTSFTVGVSVEDQYGNVLTSDAATSITLAPSASTLNGTLTKTDSSGVASFTGLSMDTAGTYTITAAATGLTGATSSSFTISAGAANKLAFTTEPSNTTAGTSFDLTVAVEDQFGNTLTADSATKITLAPSSGQLNGTIQMTDTAGVAAFTGLSIPAVGSYTLAASASGLTTATSASFEILGPSAAATPSTLTFAASGIGAATSAQTITIANAGTDTLAISGLSVSGPFELGLGGSCSTGGSVAAGSSCTVDIVFTPTATGAASGEFTVVDNANNVIGATQTVALSGSLDAPETSLSPSSLNFIGVSVGVATAAQTVTLTNSGNASLGLSAVTVTGNFAIGGGNCAAGLWLAAGASCTVNVAFTPAGTGASTGALRFTDNANNVTGAVQSVLLSGDLTAPLAVLGAAPVFPATSVGGSSTGTATLTNVGNATLTIQSATPAGPFTESDHCNGRLAAGASCTLTITFSPTASGTASGTLTIVDNSDNVAGATQSLSLSATGLAGIASVAPSSLDFGSVNVGSTSAAQTVVLTNTGNAALMLGTPSISGAFQQASTCGTSLAVGASCDISVTYVPNAMGAAGGTLTLSDNSNQIAGATQTVALSGTGLEPIAAVAPVSLDFGSANVGATTAQQTVVLSNNGNETLSIAGISIAGDFTESSACGATLAAGASCNITVAFAPLWPGSRSGSLTVTDNSRNVSGSTQTVGLTGVGTIPVVSLSPTSLSFSGQPIGTDSAAQIVTLTNTGTGPLTLASIVMTGEFSETNDCPNVVAAGAACTINIVFAPVSASKAEGVLSLNDDAGGSPQTVSVTGTPEGLLITAASGSSLAASVSAGNSATYDLTATPVGGVSGNFSLTCSGAPAKAACTVDPTAVDVTGVDPTSITVTVSTTSQSNFSARTVGAWRDAPGGNGRNPWPWLALLACLGSVWTISGYRPRLRWAGIGMMLVLLAGCSGHSSASSASGGGGQAGTPSGTYQLTITASNGAITQSQTLTLTVK